MEAAVEGYVGKLEPVMKALHDRMELVFYFLNNREFLQSNVYTSLFLEKKILRIVQKVDLEDETGNGTTGWEAHRDSPWRKYLCQQEMRASLRHMLRNYRAFEEPGTTHQESNL